MHCIDSGEALEQLDVAAKKSTNAKLIGSLFDLGKNYARQWLLDHQTSLNVASSVNISRD